MGGLLAQLLAERKLVSAAVFISPTAPTDARDWRDHTMWASIRLFDALGTVPSRIPPGSASRRVLNVADEDAADASPGLRGE